MFQVPSHGTYVLHPGVCPEYRNAHGCFWALASGDLERVGLTLLRIDAGVDTGPIYGYFTYRFDERQESHVRIQQRVLTENLDAIRDRLLEAVAGRAERIDTSGRTSAVWGQPWMTAFARWKWAARRRTGGAHAGVARTMTSRHATSGTPPASRAATRPSTNWSRRRSTGISRHSPDIGRAPALITDAHV